MKITRPRPLGNKNRGTLKLATVLEIAQIDAFCLCSSLGQLLANAMLHFALACYGQSQCENAQTFKAWIVDFRAKLLEPAHGRERQSLLSLNTFGRVQRELTLVLMFLFGQHARLEQKFGQAVPIGKRQHRNNTHRDADCTLLRHGVFLVGSPDVTRTPPSSRMATLIRKYIPKVLKLDPKLQPGTVMRLLVLAEWAATGAAVPRSRDVLYKIFAERRAPLWRAVQARGLELIKQGFSDMGVL